MRAAAACKLISLAAVVGLLTLSSGCTTLEVNLTSTPDTVTIGDLVTFNIKITNRSQCPVPATLAELIAFIPAGDFFRELFGDLPPDLPPEVRTFFDELRVFFDELCTGGQPELPTPPMFSMMSCRSGDGEVVCSFAGALFAQQGGTTGSMSFGGLDGRLRCEVDALSVQCELHIALPSASTAARGSGAGVVKPLTCLPFGSSAICFVGTFPTVEGLAAGQMAQGQVMLPAFGSGLVRNLVFAISTNDEDLGVCKGGSDAGEACDQSDTTPCSGGSCEAGICTGPSANVGKGCNPANAAVDCPGGTCQLCTDVPDGFLPIACTTTNIEPEGAPAMSPWGLTAAVVALLGIGSFWLRRGRRKA